MAFRKSGQLMNGYRLEQLNAKLGHRFGGNALRLQNLQISLHRAVLGADAQCHGRRRLRRLQNGLPLLRVVCLQALDPPSRMVPKCSDVGIGLRYQGLAFSQEAAQTRVDKRCLRTHVFVPACRLNGLVDQGVNRIGRQLVLPRQGQCCAEQGICLCGRCFARQAFSKCQGTSPPTHGLKRQCLNTRSQIFGNGFYRSGHRAAVLNGQCHLCRSLQQLPKRCL